MDEIIVDPEHGGYIEFAFTKNEYDLYRGPRGDNVAELFKIQLEKLVTQFPNYDYVRVVLGTKRSYHGSTPKVKK